MNLFFDGDGVVLKKFPYFTNTFFTCDLKHNKNEKKFYQSIINQLKIKPKDFYYWDDDQKNISLANSMGINAFLFKDAKQLKKEIANL